MFRTVPLSIISSFSLYTQQWYMSYRFADSLRVGVAAHAHKVSAKPVWHIPLLCVQWKTPDDGQRNCPKHVEFCSKNKFEKLVHLVDFIIRTSTTKIRAFKLPRNVWLRHFSCSHCTVHWAANRRREMSTHYPLLVQLNHQQSICRSRRRKWEESR